MNHYPDEDFYDEYESSMLIVTRAGSEYFSGNYNLIVVEENKVVGYRSDSDEIEVLEEFETSARAEARLQQLELAYRKGEKVFYL